MGDIYAGNDVNAQTGGTGKILFNLNILTGRHEVRAGRDVNLTVEDSAIMIAGKVTTDTGDIRTTAKTGGMIFSGSVQAGNDIIAFDGKRGVYPDSAYTDYKYTRRMSRFDDYTPTEAYWEGYRDGRWTSPWYYSSYYSWYDPWYYDPWYYGYYGWYGGWYSPYYTWYSPWRYPYYGYWGGWYGPRYTVYRGGTGARWSRAGYSHHKYTASNHRYNGSRNYGTRTYTNTTGPRSLGGYRSGSSINRGTSSFGGGSHRSGGFSGGGGGMRSSGGGGHSYGGRR
jgi:uncharacterized membrane protein YgcG